jgi:hypothetical protein
MATPLVTSVTIDGDKFDAMSVSVGLTTQASATGKPAIGNFHTHIEVVVDIHDDVNMPFPLLFKLFGLAKIVTSEKIKDIKIEFWKDESRQDVICSYVLQGWISHFETHSRGDGNHTLVMSIQPTLDPQNLFVIDMSN